MGWVYLSGAILFEVGGTLCLRVASAGRVRWYAPVVAGYVASFAFLSLTLAAGVGLGVAYGIWSAIGVALTALMAKVLFKEPLTGTMLAGIGLIMLGVLVIESGANQ